MSTKTTTITEMDNFVLTYASVGLHNETGLRAAYDFGMMCDELSGSGRHSWTELGNAINRGPQTPQRYARLYTTWANKGGADALAAAARKHECYDTAKLATDDFASGTPVVHFRLVPKCRSCGSHDVEKLRMNADTAQEIFDAIEAASARLPPPWTSTGALARSRETTPLPRPSAPRYSPLAGKQEDRKEA